MAKNSTRDLKRRIRSIGNTKKITKALETVSAVKMRKAQAAALAGQPFALEALTLLRRLAQLVEETNYPLLRKKNTGKQLLLIIAPDKGLTGGLMSNLTRKIYDLIEEQKQKKQRETEIWAIGQEANNFAERSGYKIYKSERNETVNLARARALKDELTKLYLSGPYDKIILAYSQFESTLRQKPFIRGILPITVEKIVDVEEIPEQLAKQTSNVPVLSQDYYELEPTPEILLRELIPNLVTMLLYHTLQEAAASEHSARMLAMKNAHDNASDLIEELNQTYNRLRQESITSALAEISAGVAALERS